MLRSEKRLPASLGTLAPHSLGGHGGFPGQSETAGEDAEATLHQVPAVHPPRSHQQPSIRLA